MSELPTVFITGVHSGPSPSAGVGVAKCLRDAFEGIELVAVDYSERSTGLQFRGFNRIAIPGTWDTLDPNDYGERIKTLLDKGNLWISSLDLEVVWLARRIGPHPKLAAPGEIALAAIRKPGLHIAEKLGLSVPNHISLAEDDRTIYDFLVHHNWRVWLKGPHFGATSVTRWRQLRPSVHLMKTLTSAHGELFLQADVPGYHYSIAFVAWQGQMLDAIAIKKESTTSDGKTWTGRMECPEVALSSALAAFCKEVSWCGGGEIECICDDQNTLWLLECNPRFPAWIYGARIGGHNLPAALVTAMTGVIGVRPPLSSRRFTRIVIEIAAQDENSAPPIENAIHGLAATHDRSSPSSHPSGMAFLADRLRIQRPEDPPRAESGVLVPRLECAAIARKRVRSGTPRRLLLPDVAAANFGKAAAAQSRFETSPCRISFAYSIKTNPDHRLIRMANHAGLWSEAISQDELGHAIACGVEPPRIVLNGPGKWWPKVVLREPVGAVFCDSFEELARVKAMDYIVARAIGVRIRPTNLESRFGISVSDRATLERLSTALRDLPETCQLGVHFHIAASKIGTLNWLTLVASLMELAKAIREEAGRPVTMVDFGGGLTPSVFASLLDTDYLEKVAVEGARAGICNILFEPGKALVEDTMVLATRILDARTSGDGSRELVVDASIADIPTINEFPHRIGAVGDGRVMLGRGRSRILGRLCMESDVLAEGVDVPSTIGVGDVLYFFDVGGYDASMSFAFGRGRRHAPGA